MLKNGVFSFVDGNGDEIFYRVYGEGRPVFLLHGFGMSNLHWLPFLWPMRKECQFILPDLRGFGLSRHSYHNYENSLQRHADDIHSLIHYLKLDEATLAGYSLGALISMQYLHSYQSEGLNDILIIDSQAKLHPSGGWSWPIFGDNHDKRLSTWRRLAHKIHAEHGHSEYNSISFNTLSPKVRMTLIRSLGNFMGDAASYQWAKEILRRASSYHPLTNVIFPLEYWHVFFDHALSFVENDYDFREAFLDLDIPVSLISGRNSNIFPYQAQKDLIENCPNGHHITLERSGHLLMFEEPLTFSRALSSTLARK